MKKYKIISSTDSRYSGRVVSVEENLKKGDAVMIDPALTLNLVRAEYVGDCVTIANSNNVFILKEA